MRSTVASHQKLTTTNWDQSSKLILLQLYEKWPKNSTTAILRSFGIWSKLKRWKSSISGCLMTWLEIKNTIWIIVFSYSMQQQWTISWSDCNMRWQVDFIWEPAMTSLWWTEKKLQSTSQSQTCTQKRSWSLVVCCPSDLISYLNPLHLRVCSADQSDAPKTAVHAASIG